LNELYEEERKERIIINAIRIEREKKEREHSLDHFVDRGIYVQI